METDGRQSGEAVEALTLRSTEFHRGSVSSVESVGPLMRQRMIECFTGSAETDRTDPFSSACAVFTPSNGLVCADKRWHFSTGQ